MVATLSADELASLLGTEDESFLLDVREPAEVASWSIPGAQNVPLGELADRVEELPRDRRIVTVCASGNRSEVAAGLLALAGFSAANLVGGMTAWGRVYDSATIELSAATVVKLRRRAKGCLSYLVGAGDEAFVVDPSADIDVCSV